MDFYSYDPDADFTPRQQLFPPIPIPHPGSDISARDPFSSPDSHSPYSSPSPQTTNTSFSMSPASVHEQLPKSDAEHDYSNTVIASLSNNGASQSQSQRPTRPAPPKKGDPNYIPRPENAFILFRKDAVQKIRIANAEPPPSAGKAEKGKRQRQADMSKSISQMWKALSREERSVWEEKAAKIKREHEAKHPEYRYQPSRPGASALRKGVVKRVGSARRRKQEWDEDEFSTDLSEDMEKPVRNFRRPSTSSTSSSAPQNAINLPSLHPFAAAEFTPSELSRLPSSSRQWVQPPLEDPSPPPSQLYFPHGGNLQPSLMPRHESQIQRVQPPSRLNISQVAPEESDDMAPIFVEPITSERNPWSPNGSRMPRMPSTPRRASIRPAARARSHSVSGAPSLRPLQIPYRQHEEPLSPSQMSEPEYDAASAHSALSWNSEHGLSLAAMQRLELVGSPDSGFLNSPASSQDTDFGSMGSHSFNLTDEELTDLFRVGSNAIPTFDLNANDFSTLAFFDPTPESLSAAPSTTFSYPVDPNERRGSSFF